MTTDLESRLRAAFREDAQRARLGNPDGPVDPDEPRPAPRQGTLTARWLVAAVVLILAGVVGLLLIRHGDEGDRSVTTSPGGTPRNGSIVSGNGGGWPAGAAAPERPDDRSARAWDGFDVSSGSFLYESTRIRVLDAEGNERADFSRQPDPDSTADAACGSGDCGGGAVFGPGADEVTLRVFVGSDASAAPDRLQVMAWDGTARDTIDVSAVFSEDANGTPQQELAALAWSPDGTRLAVGTVPGYGCDPVQDPCAPQVWTLDRHGRDPQLVYTAPIDERVEPATWAPPEVGDLAWSPDGRGLGVVVVPQPLGDPVWPTLEVLRFRSDGTARSDTLYDYDRPEPADSYLMQMWFEDTFPFAWSPDGTRIAVTSESGVEEISAEDGQVLARHPGVGLDDEGHAQGLAWLPAD